ncbi:MAG: L,D-transpeptidase [Bacteroidota bacterium]
MTHASLRLTLCLLGILTCAVPTLAQSSYGRTYDQDDLEALLYSRQSDLGDIPEVTYRYHVLSDPEGNSVWARHRFYKAIGDGDVRRGRDLLPLIEFINYVRVQELRTGDTLIVPSRVDLDMRAYAPFPRRYEGGAELDKLFVIDKEVQAWAAYEYGRLKRWGVVNTGAPGSRTPGGRYNFNWQVEERISSESPPGEEWLMRWVFNFHRTRGFHVHQYTMPTGAPASHGCVRLIAADAKWIYDWADGWTRDAAQNVTRQGTTVLVLGDGLEPEGRPQRFVRTPRGPHVNTVALPASPWDVPPGTEQQVLFDRLRAERAQRSVP